MRRGKRLFLVVMTLVAVLSMSIAGISCSSSEVEEEAQPSAPQEGGPAGGMSPGPGFSDDVLAEVAEILGIELQELEDAFAQAQSEMMPDFEDGEPQAPPDGQSPEDMPPEGQLPEDMPQEGMPPEGMPGGFGFSDELLAEVAEILGIDQQTLEDALAEVQVEMPEGTPPVSGEQPGSEE